MPKKIIRDKIIEKLSEGEWERIFDKRELNKLYELKVKEELQEIQNSEYLSEDEFADLLNVVLAFAALNGVTFDKLRYLMQSKIAQKGNLTNIVLTNLNPNNPSNALYFDKPVLDADARYRSVLDLVVTKIKEDDYNYKGWCVGVAAEDTLKTILFSGHNVDKNNGKWIYGDCYTTTNAKNLATGLRGTGCVVSDEESWNGTYIYAFKMTGSTRPTIKNDPE